VCFPKIEGEAADIVDGGGCFQLGATSAVRRGKPAGVQAQELLATVDFMLETMLSATGLAGKRYIFRGPDFEQLRSPFNDGRGGRLSALKESITRCHIEMIRHARRAVETATTVAPEPPGFTRGAIARADTDKNGGLRNGWE